MPLAGDPSRDIPELTRANRGRKKKRPRKQILAIAMSEQRRYGKSLYPWIVFKAMGRFDPAKHPRATGGEHGGEFTSGGGSVSRTNPDLDAAMGSAPATAPKPAGNIRAGGPDIFAQHQPGSQDLRQHPAANRPQPPQPSPPQPGKLVDMRAAIEAHGGDSGKAADEMRRKIGDHMKAGGAVTLWMDGKPIPVAKIDQNRVFDAKGQQWGLLPIAMGMKGKKSGIEFHPAGGQGGAAPKPQPTGRPGAGGPPQRSGGRAVDHTDRALQDFEAQRGERGASTLPVQNGRPRGAGPSAAAKGPQPPPLPQRQQAQPPALPHERTAQAAKAAVGAIRPGDQRSHAAAVQALDAHFKAGAEAIKRLSARHGLRGGNVYRATMEKWKAKISAARAKVDQMAGRGPPPVPRQPGQPPPLSQRGKMGPWVGMKSLDLALPRPFPWLVFKSHDVSGESRDQSGRWSSGGSTSHARLVSAIKHVSTYDPGDITHHREIADHAIAELKKMPQPDLYKILHAAGLEGIKPRDSRPKLLQRLHNRLTAGVRARERAEV